MESEPSEISSKDERYLFDINNSNNNIEYKYCPHILNHFLNPFLNSTFEKINLSNEGKKSNIKNSSEKDKEIEKYYFVIIYLFFKII